MKQVRRLTRLLNRLFCGVAQQQRLTINLVHLQNPSGGGFSTSILSLFFKYITLEVNHEVLSLTLGSPSISNDPDTASHVLPVWWPHRPHRVRTAPRTRRRTRWMEGCTPSTRRTWGKLSSWWTTWGGTWPFHFGVMFSDCNCRGCGLLCKSEMMY